MRDTTNQEVMPGAAPLKLRARKAEDYRVVSALLQDAIIAPVEMTFLPEQKRFVAVANRFRWERADGLAPAPADDGEDETAEADARFEDIDPDSIGGAFERTHCGLCFDQVKTVQRRGFNPRDGSALLNLLSISSDREGVTLQFSGGAAVRLQGARIHCHIEDLGEAWPTRWRPAHQAAGLDDDGEAR